jgi:hypothetical protein
MLSLAGSAILDSQVSPELVFARATHALLSTARGRDRCLGGSVVLSKYGGAFFITCKTRQKKIEFPPQPQPEHIEFLIELTAACQKIPQQYCLLCKAKTSLGIEGDTPGCLLRRAFILLKAIQQK